MRRFILSTALVLSAIILLTAAAPPATEVAIQPGTVVRLATAEEGAALLLREDAWIDALSPFDKAALFESTAEISTREVLDFMSRQARPFSDAEAARMRRALEGARDKLAASNLTLRFPPEIAIVKTTGKDQGDAAYCRGPVIVFPQAMVDMEPVEIEGILIHELFHVMTTHDPEVRKPLFAIIGFYHCDEVPLPDSLESRRITNPDEFRHNYYANVHCRGRSLHVMVVLVASSDYDPARKEPFFAYLTVKLMPVEERDGRWTAILVDGRPPLLEISDCGDFFDDIGRNTGYILGPEEIMAENFVSLISGRHTLRTPRIIQEMRKVLSLTAPSATPAHIESTAAR